MTTHAYRELIVGSPVDKNVTLTALGTAFASHVLSDGTTKVQNPTEMWTGQMWGTYISQALKVLFTMEHNVTYTLAAHPETGLVQAFPLEQTTGAHPAWLRRGCRGTRRSNLRRTPLLHISQVHPNNLWFVRAARWEMCEGDMWSTAAHFASALHPSLVCQYCVLGMTGHRLAMCCPTKNATTAQDWLQRMLGWPASACACRVTMSCFYSCDHHTSKLVWQAWKELWAADPKNVRVFQGHTRKMPAIEECGACRLPQNATIAAVAQACVHTLAALTALTSLPVCGAGRVLYSSHYSELQHQFLNLKHNLKAGAPHFVHCSITYAAFFQRFDKVAGMTGTACEVSSALWDVYGLSVSRHPMVERRSITPHLAGLFSGPCTQLTYGLRTCRLPLVAVLAVPTAFQCCRR
jgi:hypothetical protein